MNYITLTPETPSVRQWLDLLKDDSTAELRRVVEGDIDEVDAGHYYAAQLLLEDPRWSDMGIPSSGVKPTSW